MQGLKVTKERQRMDTQTTKVFQDKGYVIPRTAKGDRVTSHPSELVVRVVGKTRFPRRCRNAAVAVTVPRATVMITTRYYQGPGYLVRVAVEMLSVLSSVDRMDR